MVNRFRFQDNIDFVLKNLFFQSKQRLLFNTEIDYWALQIEFIYYYQIFGSFKFKCLLNI